MALHGIDCAIRVWAVRIVCETLKIMLAFDGHLVEVAHGSEEALALFRKGRYDVILTDYAMPLMRGDTLALAIKAQDPTQRVLIMSTHGAPLMAAEGGSSGIDYALGKPFLMEDLRLALKTVCGAS